MTTFFGKPWEEWIQEYAKGHQHPINQRCHKFGIPMILLSLPLMLIGIVFGAVGQAGIVLFILGWALQFIGHAAEKTWPEFFYDWRFLAVGTRWWWTKFGPARRR